MIGSDRGHRRRALGVAAVVALAGASSCENFPQVNPFDPHAVLTLALTGPDSVTSIGDTISFQVRTAKGEEVEQLATWDVPPFLAPLTAPGKFLVTGVGASARGSGMLTAHVNANQSSKTILYAQKATSMSLSWCDGRVKTLTFTALLAADAPMTDAQPVCSGLVDRRGNAVPDSSTPAGIIRDPGVVRFVSSDQLYLNAVSVGSTWIVYNRAGFTDSVRAVVRQDPAGVSIGPAECYAYPGVTLAPGQTVQLTVIPPVRDAHLNPVADTIEQRVLSSIQWAYEPWMNVTVSPTGLVTAGGVSGPGQVYGSVMQGGELVSILGCSVIVR